MCTDEVAVYTNGHLQRHYDGRFEEMELLYISQKRS